jgi:signal transduction histidine kinase
MANLQRLYTACGLVRIARPELDAWVADPKRTIRAAVFDSSDGVRSRATVTGYSPRVAKTADGKIWFVTDDGVNVIDPRHLPFNKLPPPVHIEQITADRKKYETSSSQRLPALTRDLGIEYTALSLVAPEKIRFRIKLEGRDPDWKDAGNERKAFYNDLPPRNYRFRVMASNNSGVWNEAGDSLDFSIDPAYYQTTWFASVIAAAVLAFLALLYHLRIRYIRREFNIRLEARVGERTRVARDLHDTLLQSFQGVLLKFSTVKYMMRVRPDEAEETLERTIEQARAAITEGRDAVQGLRSSTMVGNDLACAITTFAQGLAADHNGQNCPEFRLYVEGKSRDIPPLVRDEVYQIACESLRDAFRHAGARRVEVEIHYDPRLLRMRVRDDGKGIDPQVVDAGGRSGHHGLPGMRERAELVGGKLAVWSESDSGAEIELTIPSAIAYAKAIKVGGQGNLV